MADKVAPAQLAFVSSLFTSKIFWTQVVTLAALIASAAGVHVLDDAGTQAQVIGMLDAIATALIRWWFPTGPVSLSGPLITPAPQDVPVGASVVTVAAPKDQVQVTAVQPLPVGSHTVDVVAPLTAGRDTPASVTVTPNR